MANTLKHGFAAKSLAVAISLSAAANAFAHDDKGVTPNEQIHNGWKPSTALQNQRLVEQIEQKKIKEGFYKAPVIQVDGDYINQTNFNGDVEHVGTRFGSVNSYTAIDCDNGANCQSQSTVTDSNANSTTNLTENGNIDGSTTNINNRQGNSLHLPVLDPAVTKKDQSDVLKLPEPVEEKTKVIQPVQPLKLDQ